MKFAIIFFLVINIVLFLSVSVGFAQIQIQNPLKADSFQEFLDMVITFLFWLGLALAPLFILIAASYFITAAGNPKHIETGWKIITYTFIGLLIIIMARGAVEFIQRMFQ